MTITQDAIDKSKRINTKIASGRWKNCDYNTCNLFTDETLTKEYNIHLPRLSDQMDDFIGAAVGKGIGGEDWPNNPMMTTILNTQFFPKISQLQGSGVTSVNAQDAASLANQGQAVIFSMPGHISVVAPSQQGVMVYRDKPLSDGRTMVPVKPDSKYARFYAIDGDQYSNFMTLVKDKGFQVADIYSQTNMKLLRNANYDKLRQELPYLLDEDRFYKELKETGGGYFFNNFNTVLTPQQEEEFKVWACDQSKKRGRNILRDLESYDVRGFWYDGYKVDSRGHGTDKFKKPNHPTFSDESIYSDIPNDLEGGRWKGGHWGFNEESGKDTFTPSSEMLKTPQDALRLMQYFKDREKGVELILPNGGNNAANGEGQENQEGNEETVRQEEGN